MIEQSCNVILKSYAEIVNKIMELKNEKENFNEKIINKGGNSSYGNK